MASTLQRWLLRTDIIRSRRCCHRWGRVIARIERDDLRQPPKVWIRQLPDDTGIVGADREFT
jgi:hypothetical protein